MRVKEGEVEQVDNSTPKVGLLGIRGAHSSLPLSLCILGLAWSSQV